MVVFLIEALESTRNNSTEIKSKTIYQHKYNTLITKKRRERKDLKDKEIDRTKLKSNITFSPY